MTEIAFKTKSRDDGADRGAAWLDEKAAREIDEGDRDDSSAKGDRQSAAQKLIELADKHCDLFHDERGDGYAVTMHGGIRRTLKLRGREFKRWMSGTFYKDTGRAANNEAMSSALSVMEAKATFDGRQIELANRFATRDGVIYIDMADPKWRVIKVTAHGWEILHKPPVLFRRFSHQQALPEPIRGGRLSDIHKHLAIRHEDDRHLIEGWLVASVFADIPRPAPTFHGPQGASKTSSARILKSITDPSLTYSVDLGKAPAECAQILDHHAVPCFDNLTSIPGWAADMLCRGVTGGAFSKRELYSDDSDVILSFKRAMIITGINIPTHAPDLLDRLLLIELERIPTDQRMDEATFWARFNADRGRLFGALLDGISGALRDLPDITLDVMPRMADFARIACAYAEFSGIGADKMLDIIMRHTARQTLEVLESDPLASAIKEFIDKRQTWTGAASDLLKLLNESAPNPRPDGWPKQANNLTRKLNVLHATLNEIGISIRKHKEGSNRTKLLTLEKRPEIPSASSVSPKANNHAGFGADDVRTIRTISQDISSGPGDSIYAGLGDADDRDDENSRLSGEGDHVVID